MAVSVIIVNYNVKHFLEQCICSVQRALAATGGEIIVVDNQSTDQSLDYLQPRFPGVKFIANNENLGFAKACNQGWRVSTGEYVLFLNPDTIIPEDCLQSCVQFFASHPDAGAVGVKLLDGSGKFLKESKRAFPSPMTSLYKLFGLSRLFPRSKTFSRYHLGHLDENSTNEVDVLAGAFMMMRRKTLEETGGFDEVFFMYGEDVDLSYRIQQKGYKNYYFAGSSIIHFKGESTRKGTMNYVRMFYTAMSVFVRKHYGGSRAGIFNMLIHLAIWFRAGLTAIGGFIRRIGLPLIDAGLIFLSFWVVKTGWSHYIRADIRYESRLLWIAFPAFTVFYLVTAYYAGLYDRWYKRSELLRSAVVATVVLLAGYALLPEQYRFSRGIVLFGAMLAFVLISILRWLLVRSRVLTDGEHEKDYLNTVIAATTDEYQETLQLLKNAGMHERVLGRLSLTATDETGIGYWREIPQLVKVVPFREVIFCAGTNTYSSIIEAICKLPKGLVAKLHASGSGSIVSSDSKDSSGEALSVENGLRLADPYYRRIKRLIDVVFAVFVLLTFPVQLFLVKKPLQFLGNACRVLAGTRTWIGYSVNKKQLPTLRKAILGNNGLPVATSQPFSAESLGMMDHWYARDYLPATDLKLLWRSYRNLGG